VLAYAQIEAIIRAKDRYGDHIRIERVSTFF